MSKKSKMLLVFMVFVLSFVTLLQGCGNKKEPIASQEKKISETAKEEKKSEVINLTWATWGNPEEIKRYEDLTEKYNKDNPSVKLKLVPSPSDAYEQKMLTQLAGGSGPDVFYSLNMMISKLIKGNVVTPLDEYLKGPDSISKQSEFIPGLLGLATKDGKLYGAPVDCNPMVVYYNKKVFKDLGLKTPQEYFDEGKWNWSTFTELTGKVRDAGKYGFIIEPSSKAAFPWIWANGGQVYNDKGDIILDQDKKAQEAIAFLEKMVKGKNMMFSGALPKEQGANTMFMTNQLAMVGTNRAGTPLFAANKALEFDIIPYPTNTGNKTEPTVLSVAYMVMNKDTKHPKEAFKFLTYYVSKEGQKARLGGAGNAVPSIKGIEELVTDAGVPAHAKFFIDTTNTGSSDLKQHYIPGLENEIKNILESLFIGKDTSDTAAEKLTSISKKMISEYRQAK